VSIRKQILVTVAFTAGKSAILGQAQENQGIALNTYL
jgi:hypothetical protein